MINIELNIKWIVIFFFGESRCENVEFRGQILTKMLRLLKHFSLKQFLGFFAGKWWLISWLATKSGCQLESGWVFRLIMRSPITTPFIIFFSIIFMRYFILINKYILNYEKRTGLWLQQRVICIRCHLKTHIHVLYGNLFRNATRTFIMLIKFKPTHFLWKLTNRSNFFFFWRLLMMCIQKQF